ncbi:hypothetical protein KIS4809_3172 [Bacillus sp. ZZV12-4809]|nr:hypothetical protein KIS4809_3172 [Bacillus sp. ZZV12-4809]
MSDSKGRFLILENDTHTLCAQLFQGVRQAHRTRRGKKVPKWNPTYRFIRTIIVFNNGPY